MRIEWDEPVKGTLAPFSGDFPAETHESTVIEGKVWSKKDEATGRPGGEPLYTFRVRSTPDGWYMRAEDWALPWGNRKSEQGPFKSKAKAKAAARKWLKGRPKKRPKKEALYRRIAMPYGRGTKRLEQDIAGALLDKSKVASAQDWENFNLLDMTDELDAKAEAVVRREWDDWMSNSVLTSRLEEEAYAVLAAMILAVPLDGRRFPEPEQRWQDELVRDVLVPVLQDNIKENIAHALGVDYSSGEYTHRAATALQDHYMNAGRSYTEYWYALADLRGLDINDDHDQEVIGDLHTQMWDRIESDGDVAMEEFVLGRGSRYAVDIMDDMESAVDEMLEQAKEELPARLAEWEREAEEYGYYEGE